MAFIEYYFIKYIENNFNKDIIRVNIMLNYFVILKSY